MHRFAAPDALRVRFSDPAFVLDLVALSAADWYWEQDAEFRFTHIVAPDPARQELLDAFIGRRRWELDEPQALTATWDEHRAALAARLPFHDFEFAVLLPGKPSRLYISATGTPVLGDDGTLLGYRGTARDITRHWEAKNDLLDAKSLLQVAAALGRFGAWSIDLVTNKAHWTEETSAIHEVPLERECAAEDVLKMYAPEHRDILRAAFERCALLGIPYDLEVQALTAAGRRLWVRTIGIAVRDHVGQIVRVQGAYQDIDRSKSAAEKLRQHAVTLRQTLDRLTDGFGTVDREWRVTYANDAATVMLGLTGEDVIGKCLWDLFPAARNTEFEANYRRAMEHGDVRRFEAHYPDLDMWLRVSAFPSEHGISISFTDITAATQARQALLAHNAELERRVRERTDDLRRSNEELTAFTLSVAHDLRAPLGAIDGFSQALAHRLGDGIDPRAAHYVQRIRSGAQRMGEQISGLLELARIGTATLERREVDLTALARDVVEGLRASVPREGIEVCIEEGVSGAGDPLLLRTVLENLLGNAWKFTSCQPAPRIAFGRDEGGAYWVRDNGAGFDMNHAENLLIPFRRLHDAGEFEGLGIGLASVHRVVERHGGRIWACSDGPGTGATFFFTLPNLTAE